MDVGNLSDTVIVQRREKVVLLFVYVCLCMCVRELSRWRNDTHVHL